MFFIANFIVHLSMAELVRLERQLTSEEKRQLIYSQSSLSQVRTVNYENRVCHLIFCRCGDISTVLCLSS